MSITVDVSEVRKLEQDLGRVSGRVLRETEQVVARGAQNIKTDWSGRWKGLGNLPHLHAAINYDLDVLGTAGQIHAEIGADRGRRQGNLAHIAEFGSPSSGAHPGGAPALAAEEPRFVKALADAAGKALQ